MGCRPLLLELIAWAIALPISGSLVIFLAETTFGIPSAHSRKRSTPTVVRVVLLMPAHNEAGSIAMIIAKLGPILSESVSLLVVADNCTDATAQIARDAGATVIERTDALQRGKGFALAFGRDHLRADPPDCVIVFDADCESEPASIVALAAEAMARNAPVQACYLMQPDRTATPMVQISNFAFWLKNRVRQRGSARLGAAAILTGTGMAFPYALFAEARLATSNIVEDLGLGIDLTKAGFPPVYLDQAKVWSAAAGHDDTLAQRTRWEHGFIAMARRHGLGSIGYALRHGNWKIAMLGAHLLVPPLTLLMTTGVVALVILAALCWLGGPLAPLWLLSALLTGAILAIFVAWAKEGQPWLAPKTLLMLPFYVAWKIPVFLKLVRAPQTQWNRTERSGQDID